MKKRTGSFQPWLIVSHSSNGVSKKNCSKRCIPASELKAPLLPKPNFSSFRPWIAKESLKTTLFTILLSFGGMGKGKGTEKSIQRTAKNREIMHSSDHGEPDLLLVTAWIQQRGWIRHCQRSTLTIHFCDSILRFPYQSFLKSSLDWLSSHNSPQRPFTPSRSQPPFSTTSLFSCLPSLRFPCMT